MKKGQTPNDLIKKYQVTKEIFDHEIDMTKHEDEKAARILFSMAFITAAAATIFSCFLDNRIKLLCYGYDVISLFFSAYILFVVVGTSIMLGALGPKYEMPKIWSSTPSNVKKTESEVLESLLFHQMIAKVDEKKWVKYFSFPMDDILKKICYDHIHEARLISIKVTTKVKYVKCGRNLFIPAMFFLIIMTLLGIMAYLN